MYETSQKADKVPAVSICAGQTFWFVKGDHILSNILRFGYECEFEMEKALLRYGSLYYEPLVLFLF